MLSPFPISGEIKMTSHSSSASIMELLEEERLRQYSSKDVIYGEEEDLAHSNSMRLSFLQWAERHRGSIDQAQRSLRTAAYLLPGRFSGSESLSELCKLVMLSL